MDLKYIETILTQDGRSIKARQADEETLWSIGTWLDKWMAAVISNYDNGLENELSGQCEKACST